MEKGLVNKKCHAGTEARGKEPLSRHGTAGKYVGERIGGYLVFGGRAVNPEARLSWTHSP